MIESILASLATAALTSRSFLLYSLYAFTLGTLLWASWVTLNVAYNRKKRLVYKVLLYLTIIPGALVDALFNVTVGTLLFWELPHETTLSMRLTRYISKRTPNKKGTARYGYRVPVAVWIATNLVEPWQRGHIGLEKYGFPAARDAMPWLLRLVP